MRKIFIIRAPSFVTLIYQLIQPVLAKQTQQKVEFLGADWKERLTQCIDPAILPEHWGGTLRSADGGPYGDVKMGGKVPPGTGYGNEFSLGFRVSILSY